jgi:hypothetical protein
MTAGQVKVGDKVIFKGLTLPVTAVSGDGAALLLTYNGATVPASVGEVQASVVGITHAQAVAQVGSNMREALNHIAEAIRIGGQGAVDIMAAGRGPDTGGGKEFTNIIRSVGLPGWNGMGAATTPRSISRAALNAACTSDHFKQHILSAAAALHIPIVA